MWAGIVLVVVLPGCKPPSPEGISIFPNLVGSGVDRGSIGISPLSASLHVGEKLEVEASLFLNEPLRDRWWSWTDSILEVQALSCSPLTRTGSKWTGTCRAEVTGRRPGERRDHSAPLNARTLP